MTDLVRYLAGMVTGAVIGYLAGRQLPRRLPVESCGKLEPHGMHRHSPVASRICPGVSNG